MKHIKPFIIISIFFVVLLSNPYNLSNRIQNLFIKKCAQINSVETEEDVVYLTFDDGPEPGITEFVLEELKKYNYSATFFAEVTMLRNIQSCFNY